MNNVEILNNEISKYTLQEDKAIALREAFLPMLDVMLDNEAEYNDIISEANSSIDKKVCKRATVLRRALKKIRVSAENTRKEQKAEILSMGRAVDGFANIVKNQVETKEKNLKDIENYFENIEKERLNALQKERASEVEKYGVETAPSNLCDMDDGMWSAYISGLKAKYEEDLAEAKRLEQDRIEAEKKKQMHSGRVKECLLLSQFITDFQNIDFGSLSEDEYTDIKSSAESSKQKYEGEQERIRKENEELKRKAEEAEKKRKGEERARVEKEREEREERERKEAEEKAKRDAKEAKLKAEHEAKLKSEREEKERLEKEIAERKAEEKRKAEEAERALQAELNKGDSDKVRDLIKELESIKTKYNFDSAENVKMYSSVCDLLDKVIVYAESNSGK